MPRAVSAASLAVVGLWLLGLAAQAPGRYLVNDDYQFLHLAWLRFAGHWPVRDFHPPVFPPVLLPMLIAPLFRLGGAVAVLGMARAGIVLVLAGQAWAIHHVTRILFGQRAAPLAALLSLTTAPVVFRGLDIRPDTLTTLLCLALIATQLGRRPLERAALLLGGALMGALVINRFKAAVVIPPFLALVAVQVWSSRPTARAWARAVALLLAGFALTWIVFFTVLADLQRDGVDLRNTVAQLTGVLLSHPPDRIRSDTLLETLHADGPFWLLAILGLALATRPRPRAHQAAAAALCGTAVLLVALNPALYAYNLVTVMGLLSPFAALGLASTEQWLRRARVPAWGAAALCLGVAVGPHAGAWASEALRRTNGHQLALERAIDQLPPDAKVLSLDGIGITRPSLYHWYLCELMVPAYTDGAYRFEDEVRSEPPSLVVESYRTAWLTPSDRRFIGRHYLPVAPHLWAPGVAAQGPGAQPVEVLVAGRYAARGEGTANGRPFTDGQVMALAGGTHQLACASAHCSLQLEAAAALRATLASSSPWPYLLPPLQRSVD